MQTSSGEIKRPVPRPDGGTGRGSGSSLVRGYGSQWFWTRQRDGLFLVTICKSSGRSVTVQALDPATQTLREFPSLRQFWKAMGRTSPVSVKRYLGRERKTRRVQQVGKLLEMFAEPEPPRLGIDLAARGHEVRKLMWAGFGHKILRAGYDPEDVLQEIFRGIIARNAGICPWDARKSSFGHYVHMVIGCILTNYHRKQQGVRDHESVGLKGADGKDGDAATHAVASEPVEEATGLVEALVAKLPDNLRDAGRKAMAVLADGGSHREAAKAAGLKMGEFESLVALLRA